MWAVTSNAYLARMLAGFVHVQKEQVIGEEEPGGTHGMGGPYGAS